MKYCNSCKQYKIETDFSKDRTSKDGLRSRCKQCDSDYRNSIRNGTYVQGRQQDIKNNSYDIDSDIEIIPQGKKKCNCCRQVKDLNAFYRNKNHSDGRAHTCKDCQEARRRGEIEPWKPQWQIRNEQGQKQCSKCKQWKNESEFSKGTLPDGLNTICKECDKHIAASKRKPRNLYSYELYNEQGQKQCSKCKQWKAINDFCICTANKDGRSCHCRQCQHEYDIRRNGKLYVPNYLLHKDGKKFCSTCNEWVDENNFYKSKSSKDGLSSRCKFCQQAYDKEHRKQINERQRQYKRKQAENVTFRLNDSFSSSIRQSLKENKAGYHWEDLVNYNLQDLILHLEKQFDRSMSWNNYGLYWEVDHIIPKNTFIFSSYKDKNFQICWSLLNLRPLSKIENRQRPKDGSDIPEDIRNSILGQKL